MAKYYKFDSGLVLLYEYNNINKSTGVNIAFDCGSRCDGDLPGLSHFCEHMLLSGTEKLTKAESLKRYFDFVRVNLYTSHTSLCFTGNIITSKLASYFDCVQDFICNSTFKVEMVEEEKKVIEQEIATDADKHYRRAEDCRMYETYEEECYKNSILGTRDSVNKITRQDVKKYVKKYLVGNNCIVSVCSPLSFAKVKNIVKKYFESKMPNNKLKPLPYKEQTVVDDQKVKVYKKDIDKAFLSIVFKCDFKGPDLQYYVGLATVCNMIDDISNGLTKELRIDNSLVYGMWADNRITKNNSCISLNTEIFKENIKPCLDVMANYIKRIASTGFTQQELDEELGRNEYYWQTRVPHPDYLLDSLTRYRWYGRFVSDKEIYEYSSKVTLQQVNDIAKALFTNPNIKVIVYGNVDKADVYTLNQIKNKF